MSLPHFYLDDQVVAQETADVFELRLSADDARHARVLRLAPGEHIALVDAARDYFECEVVRADRDGIAVRIAQHLDAPDRPCVVLVQGLAKGEKMDTVVRHATEVGVAGIIPLACTRSVVKLDARKAAARRSRWETIAKSAAAQAGRADVPEIGEVASVAEAAAALATCTAVLVCWEEAGLTQSLSAAISSALTATVTPARDARIAVVVGPEGGLEQAEVDTFLSVCERAYPVTLGPTILRTETAGIVAPALVLYELEGRA